MMTSRQSTATWAGTKTTVLAIWGARDESIAAMAERTATLLAALDDALGARQWLLSDDRPFPPDPASQAVVLEELVDRDGHGDMVAAAGVSFALFSGEGRTTVTVRILAGAAVPTRRVAPNRIVAELVPADRDALSSLVVNAVFNGVVRAWSPSSAAFRDPAVTAASQGRGGYAPLVGYRSWVSRHVGTVDVVADGLTVEKTNEGCLIVTPDDWSADEVVAAGLATLDKNGLVSIPREEP